MAGSILCPAGNVIRWAINSIGLEKVVDPVVAVTVNWVFLN